MFQDSSMPCPNKIRCHRDILSQGRVHKDVSINEVERCLYIQIDMMIGPYEGEADLDTCGGKFKFQIFNFSRLDKVITYRIYFE